jgi:glycosyltransferase involved in cell wall biosynthesis
LTEAVSLFFPMFNEERNISRAVESALTVLEASGRECEVIVVDDGSRDDTGAIADRLAAADCRVKVVHHPENRGYGAALRSGFAAARHPLVAFVDGDNQFDLGEIRTLLDVIDKYDLVAGYRVTRRDPPIRRLNAFLYNRVARTLFDIPLRDVNCGFKIYRRELVQRLLPQLASTGALINVEMLARARQLGARVKEIGVQHYPRVAGTPTGGNLTVIVRAARELIALKRDLR